MKLIKYFFTVATALLVLASCSKDENVVVTPTTKLNVKLLPLSAGIENATYSDLILTFTELNTKKTQTVKVNNTMMTTLKLNQGSYEVSVTGNVKYQLDNNKKDGKVGAFLNELNLTKDVENVDIQLVLKAFSKDLIIEEIFFTGTLTPEGKQYNGDKYIKLYNNTDEVLYADGLLIMDSNFMTTFNKFEYTPNVIAEAFSAGSIIQIPGSGKEHPVKPGASIVIADNGINHIEYNSKSIDLSKVDFEIYNEKPNYETDSPTVPNVENLYDQLIFHNTGTKSYALARLPKNISKDKFLKDYEYHYKMGSFAKDYTAYKIPNEWVIDAVNISIKTEFKWIVTSPSLDSGWTYCTEKRRDNNRYGKAVHRKVLQDVNGKRILKDTNNSTNDFDIKVKPSLMK